MLDDADGQNGRIRLIEDELGAARAQGRKPAGGSTAGTVDGVGTAARFRQVAILFDAATFPQRSESEHGAVMVCLQG